MRTSHLPELPTCPFAVSVGFHGAFAFPIKLHGHILGVLECFSHDIRQPDEAGRRCIPDDTGCICSLSLMGSGGTQVLRNELPTPRRKGTPYALWQYRYPGR